MINYKGIYYGDDQGQKYTDAETGAHFEFKDMCRRLQRIMQKREGQEQSGVQNAAVENTGGSKMTALQKEKEEFLKSLGMTKGAPSKVKAAPIHREVQQPLPVVAKKEPDTSSVL